MSTNPHPPVSAPPKVGAGVSFLFENSLFLIGGAMMALVWANWHEHGYHHLVHLTVFSGSLGEHLNLHFLVNDVLMALFFAIAAKEVWESFCRAGLCRTSGPPRRR